jgi:hypothetical protein
MDTKATLLLTSAIFPSSPVALNDPHLRLAQTLWAIQRWCQTGLVENIVIADASGTGIDLSKLDAEQLRLPEGVNIEWLAFDLKQAARERGKGYAEAVLIERAIQKSEILKGVSGFYKSTGRLFTNNFAQIHAGNRGSPLMSSPGDTRFYWVSKKCYLNELAPLADSIHDRSPDTFIESVFMPVFTRGDAFVAPPQRVGRDGTNNTPLMSDYPDLSRELQAAQILLAPPDLRIYCLYHKERIAEMQARGFHDPEAEHVTYVKAAGDYTYPCKRHLDLKSQPWFHARGAKFGEYEFLAALYEAAKSGDVQLSEYLGFAHWDMRTASYGPKTVLAQDDLVVLCPYTVEFIVGQNIMANDKNAMQAFLDIAGAKDVAPRDILAMCTGVIMHRNVFLTVMPFIIAAMDDPTSLVNTAKSSDPRWPGGMTERLFAALLYVMKLRVIYHPIEHLLAESTK